MEEVIITICAIVVLIVGIGSFFSFLYAIYLFLFSKGKDENKTKGRNAIRYMLIGVVLSVLFLSILPLALKGVNIELKDYSTKSIFSRVGEVVQKAFQIGTIVKEGQTDNQYRGQPYINIDNSTGTPTGGSPYQL
ncbi:MAG: hypothetical protein WCO66_01770 [Candidatus Absconditabacteria bacterium]